MAHLWAAAFGRGDRAAKRYATEGLPEMAGFTGFLAVIAQTASGHVAGFACGHDAMPHRPWFDRVSRALDRAGHRAWLDDPFELAEVMVHSASQGRGIGTSLCRLIQDCVVNRPALLVTYHGDHPAKRFYQRLG